jgi:hypothetical protein
MPYLIAIGEMAQHGFVEPAVGVGKKTDAFHAGVSDNLL